VRPLIAPASAVSTYKTSRRAEIIDHATEGGPARLISAIGGKWTTARHVAEKTVDRVCETLRRPRLTARTAERRLPGGDVGRFESFVARLAHAYPVLPSQTVHFLARSYGSTVGAVLAFCREDAGLLEPLAAELPPIGAQVIHAVEHEMALTLEDVVFRRTGLGTLGFPGDAALARAAALMAMRLGWDARECARQCESVRARFAAETLGEGSL
jgi:glycerol-3-phosphate dehydrogenase